MLTYRALHGSARPHLHRDYVSSCGIPLVPVVYSVYLDLGEATAATRVVTGGV